MTTTAPDLPWWETVSTSALLRAAWRAYGDVVRTALGAEGFDDLPRNGAYVIGATARESLDLRRLPTALGVTKQAFSQLVDSLVTRGYVERHPDPDDRRRVVLALTERGEAAAAVVESCGRLADAALVDRLDGDTEAVAGAKRVLAVMTGLAPDLGLR